MTNYSVKDVDGYISSAPKGARPHLTKIRAAVKSALPGVIEKIGYGKPYYKTTRWLVGFDVYTHHIGFEIWDGQLPNEIRAALEDRGYKTGNKTFQIRYDQKVPVGVIRKLPQRQTQLERKKDEDKRK